MKFSPKPSSKNFELGMSSKIHCKAMGSTKIYWKRGEDEEQLETNVADINGTLYFDNVILSNKGTYTCFASNDEATIKTSIEIGIMPRFELIPPETFEAVENQPVFLNCSASGSPEPTLKWFYKFESISDTDDDERYTIFQNGTLLISKPQQEDEGNYACTIGNSAGFKVE